MRTAILVALALTFAVAATASACGGDDEDELGAEEVSFGGTDTLTPITDSPLYKCTAGTGEGIPRVWETDGEFTLMGRSLGTYVVKSCELVGDEVRVNALAIITGENGDDIFIYAHSVINAQTGELTGGDDIIGGTGSLEGATGFIDVTGTVDLQTLIATDEFSGTIKLPGSHD